MEASQQDYIKQQLPHSPFQKNSNFLQTSLDFFSFLKADEDHQHSKSPSFFSENGLSQDIIEVTGAEPDICLEAFYALYHVLWPQIEKQSDVSFQDAWTDFIGGSLRKGSLCPPERLITEKKIRVIEESLSEAGGESQIFQDLDGVLNSISHLKQKVVDYSGEISQKAEIIASLSLLHEFYLRYRDRMKALVHEIIDNEKINASSKKQRDELEDLLEPKATMMSDSFSQHWAYRIPRSRAQKLLSKDTNGRNLKNNSNDPSNHRVIALPERTAEPLVYFKANGNPPIQPEKEFMLESLYRHLQIPVPETALLVLTDVFEADSDYFYAIQASEGVHGESPLQVCQDEEAIFDDEAFVLQVIGALLTNPSDGSFKNFKYSPAYQTFISIDNDLVFKPELVGKDGEKIVNVKSMLYLLPQIDLKIPESLKAFFTSLDPHLTVLSWLQDLSQKNFEYNLLWTRLTFQKTRCFYQNLLPKSEVPSLTTCLQQIVNVIPDLHSEAPFCPQILISQGLLNSLKEKLQTIEKILLTNRPVSSQALLEEISPILGKYYRKLRYEFSGPEEALEALWGNKKNEIDYSEILSLVNSEELNNLSHNRNDLDESLQAPETFWEEYKDLLFSGQAPLDRFIRRQFERKKKNAMNLRVALKELQFLVREGFTDSQSPGNIVDFCHSLSKIIENKYLIKEISSLLTNLPQAELKWLFTLEKHFLRADRSVSKSLIPSSVTIVGAWMKQRIFLLTESEYHYIFDVKGSIRKNASLTGRSNVTCFPEKNPEFYLKQYPEWPGYEFASISFMRLLGVNNLPYQDFIIINSRYPVLLTQKVYGEPVLRIWENPKAFHQLDPFHTGLLIISAMLINPEDGKEDNFILSPDGRYLIPIDNDHCFLPSFIQKEGSFWNAFTVNTALQTKTLLFCLDEMYMPIPLKVKQQILSLNFDQLFVQWMTELDKTENKLNNLGDQTLRSKFLEQGTVMRIPFYKQFIENIYWKAHKIQEILQASAQPTPFDLLTAVEPFATRCYQDSFKRGNSLQARFKAATHQLYTKTAVDGSRVSILNTRTMMEIVNISEEDLKKDAAFQRMGPLDAVELLEQLIQERSERVRREQDLLCELDENNQEKKWIRLFGNSPVETSLKAFFANPKESLVLKGSKLITSSKLKELFSQTPNKGMRIRFLSLPNSPELTDKEIRILAAECPNLEYLNVSGCAKLNQLITAKGEWPLLVRLEARHCLKLKKFVSFSPIKILRIESDQEMEISVEKSTLDIFTVSMKRNIGKVDFSLKHKERFQLESMGQILSNSNLIQHILIEDRTEHFQNLKITLGKYSILSERDLEIFITFINLQGLKLKTSHFQIMGMFKLVNLKRLDLSKTGITAKDLGYLILGSWPKLNHLDLSDNNISDEGLEILCQGNWSLLESLNLGCAEIRLAGIEEPIKTSKWPLLKHLNLSRNQINGQGLETLCQADWPFFQSLELAKSQLTQNKIEIIIRKNKWPQLKNLNLSYNSEIRDQGLAKLCEGKWFFLETLNLEGAGITSVGVGVLVQISKWSQLKHLNLSKNLIRDQGLELLCKGGWPSLETLELAATSVTPAGIEVFVSQSKWPNLKRLNLNENDEINDKTLEILFQGNWPLLEALSLDKTKVTKKGLLNMIWKLNWFKIDLRPVQKSFPASLLLLKSWSLLEELNLSSSQITQNEIEIIIKNDQWSHLKHLNVSHNQIQNEGFEMLFSSNWNLLEYLNLEFTGITDENIQILGNKSSWPNLKELHLSRNKIQDEGLKALSFGKLPLLEILFLSNLNITETGIADMVSISNWPNLKILDLSENKKIFYQQLGSLASGKWPLLECLNLNLVNIPWENLKVLVQESSWPSLKRIYSVESEFLHSSFLFILPHNHNVPHY